MRPSHGPPSRLRRLLLQLPLAGLAAKLAAPAMAAAAKPWHLADGRFRNIHLASIEKTYADLRKAFAADKPEMLKFPLATADYELLGANRDRTTVTWIGHATLLVQAGGLNIVTDPHFSARASPVQFAGPQRGTPPGLELDRLPPIDIVLISHNHYDHLDYHSVRRLAEHSPQARFFVPLRLAAWFVRAGISNVVEHDWWEDASYKGARLTAVPAQHWSYRAPFNRNKTLWCSWAVHVDDFAFLFIGDTGYSKDAADINARLGGFDLAAIPIGAYDPRWFMKEAHQNPEEAVQTMLELGARKAVATHWGTFQLTYEPMDEPPARVAAAMAAAGRAADDFMVFKHGETRVLA